MLVESPFKGIGVLSLSGQDYALVYDWDALLRMAQEHGDDIDMFVPDTIVAVILIGLQRFHPDMTADAILATAPPLVTLLAAFNRALHLSYHGFRDPRKPEEPNPADPPPKPVSKLDRIAESFELSYRAGIRPADFWSMTPFQTTLIVETYFKVQNDQFERMIVQAWYSALFERAKEMPPLNSLFNKQADPTRINDDDDDDQIAAKRMMLAFMGATKTISATTAASSPTPGT